MKIIYVYLFLIAACGKETSVEDGSDQIEQSSTNESTTVTIDLAAVYDVWCAEKDPISLSCAKRCVKFPDRSWCGVYNSYCASEEGRDSELCSWWSENKKG